MDLVSSGAELMPLGHMAGRGTCCPRSGGSSITVKPKGWRHGKSLGFVTGHWGVLWAQCLIPLGLERVPQSDVVPVQH